MIEVRVDIIVEAESEDEAMHKLVSMLESNYSVHDYYFVDAWEDDYAEISEIE